MPPLMCTSGISSCMVRQASMKALAQSSCSGIPVATASTLGSKIMSSVGNPMPFSSLQALRATLTLRSQVSACPSSSKSITTVAAPIEWIWRAFSRNFSSPSFSEMELTIDLPCTHCRPALSISHFDESIITGTRAISGSDAMRLRKVLIASTPSISPSSMQMSIT